MLCIDIVDNESYATNMLELAFPRVIWKGWCLLHLYQKAVSTKCTNWGGGVNLFKNLIMQLY